MFGEPALVPSNKAVGPVAEWLVWAVGRDRVPRSHPGSSRRRRRPRRSASRRERILGHLAELEVMRRVGDTLTSTRSSRRLNSRRPSTWCGIGTKARSAESRSCASLSLAQRRRAWWSSAASPCPVAPHRLRDSGVATRPHHLRRQRLGDSGRGYSTPRSSQEEHLLHGFANRRHPRGSGFNKYRARVKQLLTPSMSVCRSDAGCKGARRFATPSSRRSVEWITGETSARQCTSCVNTGFSLHPTGVRWHPGTAPLPRRPA